MTFMFAASMSAGTVALAWNASADAGCSYTVYASTNSFPTNNPALATIKTNVGSNLSVTLNIGVGRWYFGATASKYGLESDVSDVIYFERRPGAPSTLRVQTP